jgi:hypothetical protein
VFDYNSLSRRYLQRGCHNQQEGLETGLLVRVTVRRIIEELVRKKLAYEAGSASDEDLHFR